MKISAVHLNTTFLDVESNMNAAENYIKEAVLNGAELVLLPEFFTSGFGFTHKLLDVVINNANPQVKLTKWSKKYNVIIGGSFLEYKKGDAFNTFSLTFPSGEIFNHKKDIPTLMEHFCYTYGDENSIFNTPIGNIGVALCWEQIRYNTVKRMIGKIDLLLAGSCWWGFCEDDPKELQDLKEEHQNMAVNAPIQLAQILKVPVVHASHHAKYTSLNFPAGNKQQTREIVGATQIIDETGNVICRRLYNEQAGIISANIEYTDHPRVSDELISNDYWIPHMSTPYIKAWEYLNPACENYYQTVSKPYLNKI